MTRAGPRSPAVVLAPSPLAALRDVALEGVAEQPEAKHGEAEGNTREESDPPLASDHVLGAAGDHQAPFSGRDPHTGANETEAGGQEHRPTDIYRELRDRRPNRVRYQVPVDDLPVAIARAACRFDE